MAVQVVVKHGDRTWGSIRVDFKKALYQTAIYMEKDDDISVFIEGRGAKERLDKYMSPESVKTWLETRGYTVVVKVKELNQGE